jgi:hypothetical protein
MISSFDGFLAHLVAILVPVDFEKIPSSSIRERRFGVGM